MIYLIHSKDTEFGNYNKKLNDSLSMAFKKLEFEVEFLEILKNGNIFPKIDKKPDFVVYININEKHIQKWGKTTFSISPGLKSLNDNLNYRFIKINQKEIGLDVFELEVVNELPINSKIIISDVKSLVNLIKSLIYDKLEFYYGKSS